MPFVFSAIVTKVIVEIPLPPGKISVQLPALRDDLQTRLFIGDGPNSSEPDMSWIILVIAGLLEVVWA
ncbi:TPA: quaternary ammonium compound-resistance protein SugE, partial [Escherichia albertii]|nr:quaternary ammonium compound-resistance protein SugE [Escherichia albertii]HAH3044498.1 quaternary ammonium compound-resistance protein SugE [Escherichia albertii]HAH3053482.1 quaternary ammonium compound-resistance protein SugE [Escherichia albertii]